MLLVVLCAMPLIISGLTSLLIISVIQIIFLPMDSVWMYASITELNGILLRIDVHQSPSAHLLSFTMLHSTNASVVQRIVYNAIISQIALSVLTISKLIY